MSDVDTSESKIHQLVGMLRRVDMSLPPHASAVLANRAADMIDALLVERLDLEKGQRVLVLIAIATCVVVVSSAIITVLFR